MSNIKLVHSGGNSVSLTTPTSNPSSNVTFKLPAADGTAGQVLQTDGNGNLSWVTLPTAGLSMADTWRLTTTYDPGNSSADFITANWERDDTNGYGSLGTGMTQSSGVFTFPSTGIYQLFFSATFNTDPSGGDTYFIHIHTTTDGSNYTKRTESGMGEDNGRPQTGSTSCLFDVTNTSTHKVKFATGSVAPNSEVLGSTSENKTYVMFLRLGDT